MTKGDSVIKKNNVLWVVSSNILTLLAAVVIGLILPKFVSYETYAGYRTYTLYIGFASLFHLGLVNGVALKFGDTDYRDLPRGRFRSYIIALIIMQLCVQAILFLCYLAFGTASGRGFYITPILFVIINLLFTNLRHFFSTVDRFSARFSTDSRLLVFYDFLQVLGFAVLIALKTDRWLYYLLYITGINVLIFAAYFAGNRELFFADAKRDVTAPSDLIECIRRGSFVMLGEMIGIGILGADSIFAQLFFDDRHFSEYTFAVYIIVAAYTLMSAADNLVFPYLKRLDDGDMKGSYKKLRLFAILMSAVMLLGILLIRPLIGVFIPAYTGSGPLLMILGGTLIFRALQGLACGNFFRALDMEKEYFFTNVFALVLAVVSDAAAFLIFGDLSAIAVASVVVFAIWFVLSDGLISKKLGCKTDYGLYVLTILILGAFYLCARLF